MSDKIELTRDEFRRFLQDAVEAYIECFEVHRDSETRARVKAVYKTMEDYDNKKRGELDELTALRKLVVDLLVNCPPPNPCGCDEAGNCTWHSAYDLLKEAYLESIE